MMTTQNDFMDGSRQNSELSYIDTPNPRPFAEFCSSTVHKNKQGPVLPIPARCINIRLLPHDAEKLGARRRRNRFSKRSRRIARVGPRRRIQIRFELQRAAAGPRDIDIRAIRGDGQLRLALHLRQIVNINEVDLVVRAIRPVGYGQSAVRDGHIRRAVNEVHRIGRHAGNEWLIFSPYVKDAVDIWMWLRN